MKPRMPWRTARNRAWNELFIRTLQGWRVDQRRIKEYSKLTAYSFAQLATETYAGCAEVSVMKVCEPAFQSLEQLENSFEILKIGFGGNSYHNSYNPDWRRVR